MTEPRYTIASWDSHPDYWAVYTIHHSVMGFFAGFKALGVRVPMWCASFDGAKKFDAFKDGVDARERALAIVDHCHSDMDGAEVRCYRRCDVYPEQYRPTLCTRCGQALDEYGGCSYCDTAESEDAK